ncbi:MAG: acyl-ACP thioesterase [Treponema sp.]|jgi:acyl-ACP thioesterase|nr:acyl-ACP thioesterase [Treponema sp.]
MMCNPANPKANGVIDIWQETLPVRFGAIDRSDKLTLGAMFQFFQEAAISHAENLGVGREEMTRTGQAWILSRMSVLAERRPEYCETITVRSWPKGSEKLFAIRNYDIRDKENIPVVSARSAWLIVDMEKRRPLRPQSVIDMIPLNEGQDIFLPEMQDAESKEQKTQSLTSLAERNNLQKVMERKALYTDIDYNGHVNNVRYIQWIEDALEPHLLENAGKIRFDINYLNEILAGESVEILSASVEDNSGGAPCKVYAFEGRKIETGQTAFRAEIRLSPRVANEAKMC